MICFLGCGVSNGTYRITPGHASVCVNGWYKIVRILDRPAISPCTIKVSHMYLNEMPRVPLSPVTTTFSEWWTFSHSGQITSLGFFLKETMWNRTQPASSLSWCTNMGIKGRIFWRAVCLAILFCVFMYQWCQPICLAILKSQLKYKAELLEQWSVFHTSQITHWQ